MIKKHLSKSLAEVHGGVRRAVEKCPQWLQPPLAGVALITSLMLWRGGIFVLPFAILGYVFGSPETRATLGPILLVALVYVPAAGFVGGMLVAIFRPILRALGVVGKYVQFILGTWVYCVALVFVIMPKLEPGDQPLPNSARWLISGIMGVVFGLAAAIGWYSKDQAPAPAAKVPDEREPPN